MNFQEAIAKYEPNKSKESLNLIVRELRQEMTLDEKIYMLSGHTLGQVMKDMIKYHRVYNVHALPAGGCIRLGIPSVNFTDGPRGIVMLQSTCFPVSSMRAATFDPDLEYRFGKSIADEALAQGANYFAGICINLLRNPRWGRSQESYGEDQFVLGEFGEKLTRSVQEEGVIACPKHYALNSMEDLRFFIDVHTDDKTLHEVYLPHFKKCVDAGALSIMGAYNRFNETYCCENTKLLQDILRKEWGFDGFVMSDFVWGVHDTEHSLRAGLDVEMMFTKHYSPSKIKECLKNGLVDEAHIDRAVENILGVLIRMIPLEKPRDLSVVGSEEHRALAQEIAEKGMTLLKNNGVLPLKKDAKILAVGPYADDANIGDHGSSKSFDEKLVKSYDGLKTTFTNVTLNGDGDVAIVFVGSNFKEEGEAFSKTKYSLNEKPLDKGGDRNSLHLSPSDILLIQTMKKQGKNVVVILYSGSAVITREWKDYADAIVMNYYSGCRGALALARLLAGEVNFSGHLPFTVAENEEDYPSFISIGDKPYAIDYGYYHGYALFDKTQKPVEYPFGFGLSYSHYQIGKTALEEQTDRLIVSVDVTNQGKMDGADVIQIYAGSTRSDVDRPHKQLKGFQRVELKARETKTVIIEIAKPDLRFYDDGRWEADPDYRIFVGDNAQDAETRVLHYPNGKTNKEENS